MDGHVYLGRKVDENTIAEGEIPLTMFHSSAVFSKLTSGDDTADGISKQLTSSYYTLHMELQRRQPTYDRVQWAYSTLRAMHTREPTESEVVAMFPALGAQLVTGILQNLLEADAVNRTAAACVGELFENQLKATETSKY